MKQSEWNPWGNTGLATLLSPPLNRGYLVGNVDLVGRVEIVDLRKDYVAETKICHKFHKLRTTDQSTVEPAQAHRITSIQGGG
jgi:hypothetical protein